MNIIFMGTPEFAVPALKALALNPSHTISAVFTRADAVSKRGTARLPSPVRVAAEELGLGAFVVTPSSFCIRREGEDALTSNPFATAPCPLCKEGEASLTSLADARIIDGELLALIRQAAPDIIVVAAYGLILPPAVLEIPLYGCVNIHASLLPRWRGAAPIQRALLAGDEKLGVSIMRMEEGLDTGAYCAAAALDAGDGNATELGAELAQLGAELLIKTLPTIADGTAVWIKQDEALVTYADKIDKQEMLLDTSDTAAANLRRVRASTSAAPAKATIAGRSVTVIKARVPAPDAPHTQKHLFLKCSDGDLEILELKPDGKKAMTATAFVIGL
ncbi:MAG: methionyl-tRNA formyltransferase [Coriobacteriia bacterium]|nr:methionyl-tRNA formyltransferase [Coriobacteriia bacterium]